MPQGNRREIRGRPRRDAGDRRVHGGRLGHRIGQGFPRRHECPGQPFHNLLGLNRDTVFGQVPAHDFQHAHPYPGKAETRVRDLKDLPLLDVGIITRHVERKRGRRVGLHVPQLLNAPLRRAAVGKGGQIHALLAPQPKELDGSRVVGGHGALGIVLRRVGELGRERSFHVVSHAARLKEKEPSRKSPSPSVAEGATSGSGARRDSVPSARSMSQPPTAPSTCIM